MSIVMSDIAEDLAIQAQIDLKEPRFWRLVNEMSRRIFLAGKYKGTYGRYNFYAYGNIITLPAECDTLMMCNAWNRPIIVHNEWFEFSEGTWGTQGTNEAGVFPVINGPDIFDRGDGYCTIQDPCGSFFIRAYCAAPEDPNLTIRILGLDENGNAIRTQATCTNPDGTRTTEWINGVQIPLYSNTAFFTETPIQFSKVTGISLPKNRNGDLRLIAMPAVNSVETGPGYLLGIYPYYMTSPSFRRYEFPQGSHLFKWFDNGTGPRHVPMNTLVRRRHVPVHRLSDFLPFENIPAMKQYFMAAFKDEEEQPELSAAYEAKGRGYLEMELKNTKSTTDRVQWQMRGFGKFAPTPGAL